MAVDTSPVEIIVRVVDANSGEVVSKVERNISSLGSAGATMGKQISEATTQGATGMQKLAREFTGGEGSIRTMNAEVRSLQGSIFGDTRAASEFLATLPKVGEAMELAFPVFGAIAVAGVLVQAGEKAHELYEKYLDLDGAAKAYGKEIAKQRDEDFTNVRSIETARDRIEEATDNLKMYQQLSKELATQQFTPGENLMRLVPGAAPVLDWENRRAAKGAGDNATKAQQQLDKLHQDVAPGLQHQAILDAIQLSHAGEARLRGEQKITDEKNKQHAIDQENQKYTAAMENRLNFGDPDAGKEERKTKDAIADQKAAAETFNLQREQSHELAELRNAATNAALHGVALYKAQEEQAIDELKYKDMDSVAARAAVHAKFHAEELARLEQERDATQQIQARAAMAGMTGIQKTQATGDIDIGAIRGDRNLSNEAKDARVAAAQMETQGQIVEQQRSFSQEINQIVDESAEHQISGFARIRADETKQLDELKKKFDATYGSMDRQAPGANAIYQQGRADLARGQSAIEGGANQQTSDLARKNAEETEQIEAQARSKFLSAEKQKTAAIETEYEERLQKYKDELNQQEISQEDFNRRVAAAAEERDAEMVQAATAARQKMASEFDSFFKGMDHPMKELQNLGEKAASQAAAAMVQKMQQHAGHGIPAAATTGAGFGGMFGKLFGLDGTAHGQSRQPEFAASGSTHGAGGSKMFAVSSAEIHVGSANIAFGGAGAGSAASPGSSTAASYLGGFGIPSRGGVATGVSTDVQQGIGFSQSSARVFGGGMTGGAGSGGASQAPAMTGGGVPSSGTGTASVMGDLQKGTALGQSAMKTFGGNTNSGVQPFSAINGPNDPLGLNKSSTSSTSGAPGSMMAGGGIMANAGGAVTGGLGLFSAYEGNGGVGGALGGAMSGMQLGMAVGGPVGAAIGAAGGAILGAVGPGGAEKARVYDLKQVRPRITADQDSYAQGGMDYLAAYSDLESADMAAKKATDAMGAVGQSYYQNNIKPELKAAEARFTSEQKAGRSMYTASAASYDIGSDYIPQTGWNLNHQGERIIPSDQNERITQAIEGGGTMPTESSSGSETHIHIHAIDAKSSVQFLMANKHNVRSALNASLAENSGGSDA